jgi:hypothetical protein
MNFKYLLTGNNIDPTDVLIMRHRPSEAKLRKVLPWLAAEKPDVFNAYQQTQNEKVEKAILAAKYVASFLGHEPGKAVFVGLYLVGKSTPITEAQFWDLPAYKELKAFSMEGFSGETRTSVLLIDLVLQDFYAVWKGKLIIGWPPPERSWWRRAHRNEYPIHAILEDSVLDAAMPAWDELNLSWQDLRVLPTRWRSVLSQWRGIYYIFDSTIGMGYVGSAYGKDNLLGRWLEYAASGHGGDTLLRKRNPKAFQFTILQRVSPDMDGDDVIRLEGTWKERLHTRAPFGLNDN